VRICSRRILHDCLPGTDDGKFISHHAGYPFFAFKNYGLEESGVDDPNNEDTCRDGYAGMAKALTEIDCRKISLKKSRLRIGQSGAGSTVEYGNLLPVPGTLNMFCNATRGPGASVTAVSRTIHAVLEGMVIAPKRSVPPRLYLLSRRVSSGHTG